MAKSKKSSVKIVTTFLCIIALIAGFVGAGFAFININKVASDVFVSGDFEVHFMELGNVYTGDCIYIRSGDTDILIDAGSRNDSATSIIEYVSQYATDGVLEYVIATHADQDHISAFYSTSKRQGIFEYFEVETIIEFANTNKTGGENSVIGRYREARDEEVASGAKCYTALECFNESEEGAQRVYQISDGVEMEILYNYYYDHYSSDENNYSVCLMFNQGDNHYLFTGDLEGEGEEHLVNFYNDPQNGFDPLPKCVLYKAGHHGSKTSSSTILMAQIQPEYVIVCCCCGTPEYTTNEENKFPTQQFIDNIAPYTDNVYIPTMLDEITDYDSDDEPSSWTVKSMNGNIIFAVTDGKVTLNFSNNNTKLKDTDWFKENREMPEAWK